MYLSVGLREEYRLRVFEIRVVKRICEAEGKIAVSVTVKVKFSLCSNN
jgi:hypothetical protein